MYMDNVGDISIRSDGIHWVIPEYYNLPQKLYTGILSSDFKYANDEWYMKVFPNGCKPYLSSGWFGIGISNYNENSEYSIRCCIVGDRHSIVKFELEQINDGYFLYYDLIPNSFLRLWQDRLVPGGNLHILFNIEKKNICPSVGKLIIQIATEEEKEEFIQNNSDTSHQTEEIEKETNECKEENADPSSGKDIQNEETTGMEKLKNDLKNILLNESVTDVVLKLQDEEYRAHRCILAARSPVFLAMMTHETKEKNIGVVEIPDADPKIIPDILNYFYTGSVDNLNPVNAMKMYTFADKYEIDELKEICLRHMLTNISVEDFCDVFTLSLRYDERDLKEACIDFFSGNSLDIIMTLKWQTFLTENPIIGNELFIKYIKLNKLH